MMKGKYLAARRSQGHVLGQVEDCCCMSALVRVINKDYDTGTNSLERPMYLVFTMAQLAVCTNLYDDLERAREDFNWRVHGDGDD